MAAMYQRHKTGYLNTHKHAYSNEKFCFVLASANYTGILCISRHSKGVSPAEDVLMKDSSEKGKINSIFTFNAFIDHVLAFEINRPTISSVFRENAERLLLSANNDTPPMRNRLN